MTDSLRSAFLPRQGSIILIYWDSDPLFLVLGYLPDTLDYLWTKCLYHPTYNSCGIEDSMAAVHSILLDFSVKQESIADDASRKGTVEAILEVVLKASSGSGCANTNGKPDTESGRFISGNIWVGEIGKILITVRFTPHGLITLNLEYLQDEGSEPLFSYEVSKCGLPH